MANSEQLSILQQGVTHWNYWRTEHPHLEIDLREAILEGQDLGGVDFSRAVMTRAVLERADLGGAKLISRSAPSSQIERSASKSGRLY